jgi:1,4-alpha-glucan branching enzyme
MLKKKYLTRKEVCKVTFYTASTLEAEEIYLVGDFNEWSESETPMQPLKDGRFKVTIDLPKDSQHQFRYLVDNAEWHNDWEADQYISNPFSGDNSVVEV